MRKTVPIITSERDHELALKRIDELIREDNPNNSDEIEALGLMIEHYESKAIPFTPADPVALIDYRMKSLGWTQSELAKRLNIPPSRMSEVMNRRRQIPKRMIRPLSEALGISAGLLLQEYELASASAPAMAIERNN